MNIFVSNLNYRVVEEDLQQLFEEFGKVDSARIIKDRETRRSRGFGFVEMADDEEGQTAIESLNGKDFKGRPLNVAESRPREER